ncbi:hypothetical protein Tel_02290 [Candidatus Tenderia electrophaga]|jgi:hypothetical protein|uniref:YeeE/YedE family protein n=1 Tax=Candidatus Tenderia electrophaga TaxID=1748243 RepID=A0A0S2TA82_9GAMM|nr:hypothetical protein Tel_02290 [Candidatus Tenderia electrophaga]
MRQNLLALLAGALFGLGLCVSHMADPAKVINFLDVAGHWDPSLILVMVGALAVTLLAFAWVLKRPAPLFASEFKVPIAAQVDRKLLLGAALFGIGWGMIGYCPGPAITALGFGLNTPLMVVLAMIAGFMVHKFIFEKTP